MKAKASLVLAPEAKGDVGEAYRWYETQSTGLGLDYFRCIDPNFRIRDRASLGHSANEIAAVAALLRNDGRFRVIASRPPRPTRQSLVGTTQNLKKWRGQPHQP